MQLPVWVHGTPTARRGPASEALPAYSKADESRLRRPERRGCVLTPSTSLEMKHYPPAMEAGLADHVWAIEEIVALL